MNSLATAILTSAVVSAAIASIITIVGQAIERRAKRRELLFLKSVELAKENRDFLAKVARETGQTTSIHDYAVYAEMYYWLLTELYDRGHLPANWREDIKTKFGDL